MSDFLQYLYNLHVFILFSPSAAGCFSMAKERFNMDGSLRSPRRDRSLWSVRFTIFMSMLCVSFASLVPAGDDAVSTTLPSSPPTTRPASPPSQQNQSTTDARPASPPSQQHQSTTDAAWDDHVAEHRTQQCWPLFPVRSGGQWVSQSFLDSSVLVSGASLGGDSVSSPTPPHHTLVVAARI